MLDEHSENRLLAEAAGGKKSALGTLLWAYYEPLKGFITARMAQQVPENLKSAFAADDIVQETYMQAFRDFVDHFQRYGPRSFKQWLFAIAENRLKDQLKAERRQKRGGDRRVQASSANADDNPGAEWLEILHHHTNTPSQSAIRHEAVEAVASAIAALPMDQRQAFQLLFYDKLKLAEAAVRMNRTVGAVRGLWYRAYQSILRALAPFRD